MDDLLRRLENWYAARCDGEWEHRRGMRIDTLDNPGWWVIIDLAGTPLEGARFKSLSDLKPEPEWISCRLKDGQFHGAGGPRMLRTILTTFLDWAESRSASPVTDDDEQ